MTVAVLQLRLWLGLGGGLLFLLLLGGVGVIAPGALEAGRVHRLWLRLGRGIWLAAVTILAGHGLRLRNGLWRRHRRCGGLGDDCLDFIRIWDKQNPDTAILCHEVSKFRSTIIAMYWGGKVLTCP